MAAVITTPSATSSRPRRAWRRPYTDNIVGIPPNATNVYICFAIMTAFPTKAPTTRQLCQRFGMSRATAWRYRSALLAVRGEA